MLTSRIDTQPLFPDANQNELFSPQHELDLAGE